MSRVYFVAWFILEIMRSSNKIAEVKNSESTFVQCVVKLNQVIKEKQHILDENEKICNVRYILKNYFAEENVEDVYEGFLRLLIEVSNLYGHFQRNITVLVVEFFYEFYTQSDPFDKDFIDGSMPEDKSIYLSALKIAAEFESENLAMISFVFRLAIEENKQKIVTPLIKVMLRDNNVLKAVEWIVFFNLREQFQPFFQQILCYLFLDDQNSLLEEYVGEDIYRRRKFISYLNKLIGMNMKFWRGFTDLEDLVLQEGKKIIDTTAKYLKLFNFPDSEAPNILKMRARRSLISHHYNWVNGEISLKNYEEIALQSMEKSDYVHRYFLDFLCFKGFHKNALIFAISLGDSLETFPKKLKQYCIINPYAVESAKEEVKRKNEIIQKQKEEEQKQRHGIFGGGDKRLLHF